MKFAQKRLILIICMLGLTVGPFQNCSAPNANDNGAASLGLSKSVAAFNQTLQPTLLSNCAGCHGGSQVPNFAVSDPNISHDTIMAFGLVNLTSPGSSRFASKINGGHQGFSSGLATAIQTYIQNWANMVNGASSGSSNGGGTAPAIASRYSDIAQKVLIPNCVSCHGAISAGGGVRLDNYTEVIKTLVAGQPANSSLYSKITSGQNHTLPIPNVSNEALSAIYDWIVSGAPNN